MPDVKLCVIARNHWYDAGVQRARDKFAENSPGYEITSWSTPPPGAPEEVIEAGWDYTAYCWKPFALKHALESAEVAILMDAAFWPIRPIQPLVDHILKYGYYLCNNGALAGHWATDRSLALMGVTRETSLTIREASSYCVGLHRRSFKALQLCRQWCDAALVRGIFEGPHTAGKPDDEGVRNPGFVSDDPRVLGHRHDQLALSILAWKLGMKELVDRPILTAYDGSQDERTVLANRGM